MRMAPELRGPRGPFRSAILALAIAGIAFVPALVTAGCSSDGDDDRKEWRNEQRDRKHESREERRERKRLERVLEQQRD